MCTLTHQLQLRTCTDLCCEPRLQDDESSAVVLADDDERRLTTADRKPSGNQGLPRARLRDIKTPARIVTTTTSATHVTITMRGLNSGSGDGVSGASGGMSSCRPAGRNHRRVTVK